MANDNTYASLLPNNTSDFISTSPSSVVTNIPNIQTSFSHKTGSKTSEIKEMTLPRLFTDRMHNVTPPTVTTDTTDTTLSLTGSMNDDTAQTHTVTTPTQTHTVTTPTQTHAVTTPTQTHTVTTPTQTHTVTTPTDTTQTHTVSTPTDTTQTQTVSTPTDTTQTHTVSTPTDTTQTHTVSTPTDTTQTHTVTIPTQTHTVSDNFHTDTIQATSFYSTDMTTPQNTLSPITVSDAFGVGIAALCLCLLFAIIWITRLVMKRLGFQCRPPVGRQPARPTGRQLRRRCDPDPEAADIEDIEEERRYELRPRDK
ncbi:uncharacterized protein LOC133179638 [Saccostrea echinata]|uniref:uncharacterized protein LOC133179638 n=1 Tax=Saccostrea echinata TaxID=191078 RepID=UPI002A834E6A|nr:uncharacterized protein LOC133179638 [Saccostrea echinata]